MSLPRTPDVLCLLNSFRSFNSSTADATKTWLFKSWRWKEVGGGGLVGLRFLEGLLQCATYHATFALPTRTKKHIEILCRLLTVGSSHSICDIPVFCWTRCLCIDFGLQKGRQSCEPGPNPYAKPVSRCPRAAMKSYLVFIWG